MKFHFKKIQWLIGLLIPALVITYWYIAGINNGLNESLVPRVTKVATTWVTLITDGTLWNHISASLIRVVKGYLVGCTLGIIIGTFMGLYKPIYKLLNFTVTILRPIPMMALIPLFILWLGIGEELKVAIIALGTFWSVLLNTIHGIYSTDPKLLEVSRALEKSETFILRKVVFPSAVPAIITGLRLAMGIAWSSVVATEMMAASKGIGYMLMFARQLSQPDRLMVGVLTIGLIGLAMDKGLLYVERKIVWWT